MKSLQSSAKKVAVIHDWLVGMRGGEKVLEAILEVFPHADLFTLVEDSTKLSSEIKDHSIHSSLMQKIPFGVSHYRHFLPVMPLMISGFDLKGYDLIVSSSHCVAKGIRKPRNAVHLSYIHAPMRYMWERFEDYFGESRASIPVRSIAHLIRKPIQIWDRRVSQESNVDLLISNSHFIAGQVHRAYGRESHVVHPFVEFDRFESAKKTDDFYLMVGAFAPNKRVDLAVRAFNQNQRKLIIIGSGQDEEKLKSMASENVQFLGPQGADEIASYLSRARAFIFPGIEDFGITPLEAMASGTPVVAYRYGGVLETVNERTGVFFDQPTAESLNQAIDRLEKGEVRISEENCRERAREFSRERFNREFVDCVNQAWSQRWKENLI